MNFLSDIYKKTLAENEKNINFWEDYLQNLNALDLPKYAEKLTVPILVPIGNRVLFRGSLKHTNEVTVALGADYFAKCSINQAEVLRQHRIKDAKEKLETFKKERQYLENQLSFNKENLYDPGQDIIEQCSEEEDKAWRERHREKVREYKQSHKRREEMPQDDQNDDELWRRLEELELQEELENELAIVNNNTNEVKECASFTLDKDESKESDVHEEHKEVAMLSHNTPKNTSKLDLLQQVIDRQKVLETKLTELKSRERVQTRTEADCLSRLDEMEQLDELEDEMNRLDDILDDDSDEMDESEEEQESTPKQTISFADDDDETLQITFKHSDVKPCSTPYDTNKGITKPSDVYQAFSNLFNKETKSILKKSKYVSNVTVENQENNKEVPFVEQQNEPIINRTIEVKDIVEKVDVEEHKIASNERPASIFKKRRQQNK